jgi:CSLREA domain-containing protein
MKTKTVIFILLLAGTLFVAALMEREVTAVATAGATITVNSTDDTLVPGDGNCTLREAINNANSNSDTTGGDCAAGAGADTIILPGGIYTLTIAGADEDNNATGDLDIRDDLTIQGAGAEITVIDANGLDRVLDIPVGSLNVELNDLTVANGYVDVFFGSPSSVGGGGIMNISGSNLTLNRSIVRNNTVEGQDFGTGGGIYHVNGTLTLNDSVVQENASLPANNSCCGGIVTAASGQPATVILNHSQVISNTATNGAGIASTATSNFSTSTVILNDSLVAGNIASGFTGGIWATINAGTVNAATVLTLNRSTVRDNQAAEQAGGINALGIPANNSGAIVTLNQSAISGNQASIGGGLRVNGALEVTVSNSTLSGNVATSTGGGIYTNSPVTLINSTLSGNSATDGGGGIYNDSAGAVTVRNSLVANSAGSDCAGGGSWSTGGFPNLNGDGSCPGFTITADPLLGPLQDNGGPTWTHALLAGSPALDTADDAVCATPPVNSTDQRGVYRPQGPACDIGAFELEVETEPINGLVATNDSPTALGAATTFTATVTAGTYVSYAWDFGDGVMGVGDAVTHTYQTVGSYTAVVTATNAMNQMTATTAVVIVEAPPDPIKGLAATNDGPTILGQPTTLVATVESGDDVSYAWDLGDGTAGTGDVVTHTYAAVGTYTAVVTATNSVSQMTATTTVFTVEPPPDPIDGLAASNDGPTILGQPTTLMATVEGGTDVNYVWDFGDGTIGAGDVVTHTYTAVGTYTAVVTATNSVSTMTASTTVTITPPTGRHVYLPVVMRP